MTDCQIKANQDRNEKIYYLPNCPYYKQVIVDLSYGDKWFCSEKQAKEAGFVLAGNTVALGAVFGVFEKDLELAKEVIRISFAKKGNLERLCRKNSRGPDDF